MDVFEVKLGDHQSRSTFQECWFGSSFSEPTKSVATVLKKRDVADVTFEKTAEEPQDRFGNLCHQQTGGSAPRN
jgi:hypothetical protein